jgi:SOS-response transcriptional repressor LexA
MKSKRKYQKQKPETAAEPGEEFFQLPRAEFLAEEIQESHRRQIGDFVVNPSVQFYDRFTKKIEDDSMKGADIREGDFVVIEVQKDYPDGCILAVQLGNKQLVRRYRRVSGRIQLQCDPPAKQIIIVEDSTPEFYIIGQIVQVIREIS